MATSATETPGNAGEAAALVDAEIQQLLAVVTPKQSDWAKNYALLGQGTNGPEAARRAGYSTKNVSKAVGELKKNQHVMRLVTLFVRKFGVRPAAERKPPATKTPAQATDVTHVVKDTHYESIDAMALLEDMLVTTPYDFYVFDPVKRTYSPKPFADIPPHAIRACKKIRLLKDGTIDFELYDKHKSVELAYKIQTRDWNFTPQTPDELDPDAVPSEEPKPRPKVEIMPPDAPPELRMRQTRGMRDIVTFGTHGRRRAS